MSNKINELKKEYNNIKASEGLIMKMNKEIKKSRVSRMFKTVAAGAAAFVVTFGIAANTSENFAYAMSNVPLMDRIIKVVTFGKYERVENGYEIKVNTPKIEGILDEEINEKLNKEFEKQAQSVIAGFEQSVKELKEQFGDETVHMGIEYNYQVKTDNEDILALDTYVYYASGSSSSVHSYYTINKHTGELYTLKGMFKDYADYITPISEYIKQEMKRINAEEKGMFWVDDETMGGFEKISEEQKFYINNEGNIVICFEKYEVAAGAQGTPEFVIPNEVIADILK